MKTGFISSILFLLSAAAFGQSEGAPARVQEPQIARIMEVANESEMDAAKVAEKKAQNPQVKAYAKKMRSAHEQNLKEMKKLAKDKKMDMENNEVAKQLKETNKSAMRSIKEMKSNEFDKAFISSQVEMHQNLLNQMEGQFIPAAQTPEFKQFLRRTRESVKSHLDEAKSLQSALQ